MSFCLSVWSCNIRAEMRVMYTLPNSGISKIITELRNFLKKIFQEVDDAK